MNNKNLVKELIQKEVKKILQEAAAFEAPEDAVFGKYLWADPGDPNLKYIGSRGYPRFRRDKAKEINTKSENYFLSSFLDYVEDPNYTDDLEKVIVKLLRPAKANGQYSRYINPPDVPVYRGMIVNQKAAAKILRLPIKEIREDANKAWYVSGGGKLGPSIGKKIMSWTTDPKIALSFALNFDDGVVEDENSVAIILVASTQTSGDFYLNPIAINRKFNFQDTQSLVAEENEVISYGPVNFTEAAFIAKMKVDDSSVGKVSKIVKWYLTNELPNIPAVKIRNANFLYRDIEKNISEKITDKISDELVNEFEYIVFNNIYTQLHRSDFHTSQKSKSLLDDNTKFKDIKHYKEIIEKLLIYIENKINFMFGEKKYNSMSFYDIPDINKILLNALALKHKK